MDRRTESANPINGVGSWHSPGLDPNLSYNVGQVVYDRSGSLEVELISATSERTVLVFEAPLAVRMVGEGSLMGYWRSGLRVSGYNIMEAKESELMRWLEKSSSGIHSLDRIRHFAVFSDDLCVEVIAANPPIIRIG